MLPTLSFVQPNHNVQDKRSLFPVIFSFNISFEKRTISSTSWWPCQRRPHRITSYFHFHGHLVNHILDHLSSMSRTVLALSSHPKVLPTSWRGCYVRYLCIKKLLLKIGSKTIKIGSKSGGGLETCLAAQQGRRGWGTTHWDPKSG